MHGARGETYETETDRDGDLERKPARLNRVVMKRPHVRVHKRTPRNQAHHEEVPVLPEVVFWPDNGPEYSVDGRATLDDLPCPQVHVQIPAVHADDASLLGSTGMPAPCTGSASLDSWKHCRTCAVSC